MKDDQQNLRAAEATARLAAIALSSVDAIVGTTPDGIVTDWNPAAERLFGYTAAEIVGRPASVLVPPEYATERRTNYARILTAERSRESTLSVRETVRKRKDGALVTLDGVRDIGSQRVELVPTVTTRRPRPAGEVAARDRLDDLGACSTVHDAGAPKPRMIRTTVPT